MARATPHKSFRRVPRRLRRSPVPPGGRSPFQSTFHPQPRQPQQQGNNKEGDMQQTGQSELFPFGSPGKDEGGLNIEDNKEYGYQVKGNGESTAGSPTGNNTRFIGHFLVTGSGLCAQPPGGAQQTAYNQYGCSGISDERYEFGKQGHALSLRCFIKGKMLCTTFANI